MWNERQGLVIDKAHRAKLSIEKIRLRFGWVNSDFNRLKHNSFAIEAKPGMLGKLFYAWYTKMEYQLQSTRHAKYLLHSHLVFTPKYRKKIFTKAHIDMMREVFTDVCFKFDAKLVEFDGERDHVHLLVLLSPQGFYCRAGKLS